VAPAQICCDVCAEVLSTCPYPLAQVMRRHGLGRMRVTQKANPDDPGDPYRSATAAPADWITLGTHDTRPIWSVVDHWHQTDRAGPWARYLAERLAFPQNDRAALAASLAADPARMVGALAADLFLGPARHVSIFFSDLLGLRDSYNVPGTINPLNWTLRVPRDFAARPPGGPSRRSATALDLPAAVAIALRARARGAAGEMMDLAAALERGA
jgi:4-alpha-glucanotransferase